MASGRPRRGANRASPGLVGSRSRKACRLGKEQTMPGLMTRRETLRRGLAGASVLALVPEWLVAAEAPTVAYCGKGAQRRRLQ